MGRKNFYRAVIAMSLVLPLASCATANVEPSASPSPTPTKTQSQTEIEKEFYAVADASCSKAQNDGVVERFVNNEPSRIIVLAKTDAYLDYSAIYIDEKGKAQVIYELELTVCGPNYLISMQEEANHDNTGDYEHYVKKNSDGTFLWTQSSYSEEGPKLMDTVFKVAGGLIVSATPEIAANTRATEYGPVSTEDMQALKDAVDAELQRLNE